MLFALLFALTAAALEPAVPPAPAAALTSAAGPAAASAPRQEGALVIDGVPPIPDAVAERTRQYNDVRGASLQGWAPDGGGLVISTRFGETSQAHFVAGPGADRRQLTFFREPVAGAGFDPSGDGTSLVLAKDIGGGENWQLYTFDLKTGRTTLLTDGASRNERGPWATAGGRFAYASTRRNRSDFDIWVMDPEAPGEANLVYEAAGQWNARDWSPDDTQLLLQHEVSVTESSLHVLDLATGKVRELNPAPGPVAYGDQAYFTADGAAVLYTSDEGAEFQRLVRQDLKSGAKTQLTADIDWDVEGLTLSKDGKRLAFSVNEGGRTALYLAATKSPTRRTRVALPPGVVGGYAFDPASTRLAVSIATAQTTSDVYVVEAKSAKVTRWTYSEVGGLDPATFVTPEIVSVPSFDGTKVPAFVYRPRGAEGPVPVIVIIHGGPEGQTRDSFNATAQYFVNELGVAVVSPNVRGSTGYGKTYVTLDNGMKREDSVKDIGAVLDWIATQPDLDASRVGVMGGSYGGYMVLASMIHYADRLRCGVDSVGISNFVSFLERTESYRRDLRRVEYGDERDPDMRAFLASISPTTNAARIQDPLFVVQGRNDPRVPMSEAEQIVKTVRGDGGVVWYLLANDEGHGFKRKSNRDYLNNAITMFFQSYLLGEEGTGLEQRGAAVPGAEPTR
ncbi:MAG: prolyl oligopeptidase family serine peptidase [Pseudomonadota bacterium]|nr:prolyl oligopeptidase family serine peptidase [Pseudomonadota bacterium]